MLHSPVHTNSKVLIAIARHSCDPRESLSCDPTPIFDKSGHNIHCSRFWEKHSAVTDAGRPHGTCQPVSRARRNGGSRRSRMKLFRIGGAERSLSYAAACINHAHSNDPVTTRKLQNKANSRVPP
ncbi:uncharacterized protein MYCFIDRAFT_153411 [Pseudocercospora fijiensis CIRAD86]|uniref:Uncharacterized protein n=1 Tax=Pseudocercospora fijiensis (strain CIRAD86) TaxID=383855 RepID=M3AZI6_PSEFD|nr:uncharacterized protein MYCFIDRAFT_153411 [Pseudocercospora fijiensis CIRAD86]EME82617.1 hypothetical protein MYCFIDRAFT_153411 [Pseudocercospora fijiensis CIRAD86]